MTLKLVTDTDMMDKPPLLFLAHRIPYPPNKGDKIRSFNLLKTLAKDYRVYLGAFVDDKHDWQYESELRQYCAEVFLLGLGSRRKYQSLKGLVTGEALTLPYYRQSRMQRWIDHKINECSITRAFVYSSAMAQYLEGDHYRQIHRVLDYVDVDSEKWREYSKRRIWPMSWLYRREAKELLRFDRRSAEVFDASVFVSASEAELFKRLAPESAQRVTHINNGVDYHYFDPAIVHENPYQEGPVLAFTGAMDYWANVDAVTWFVQKVFPAIQKKIPAVKFYIVGARPTDAVLKLGQKSGVSVTGSVEDIRPYIAHADVVVAPMRIARGVQNKVLEAMAMERPVVVTGAAMEGIEKLSGQRICDDAKSFTEYCLQLLNEGDTEQTGKAGRQRILRDFNWDQNLLKLETLFGDKASIAKDTATELNRDAVQEAAV
ncbi:MAG: TIGR03087 family PEP-CTERM/XrtA system glycosyltransferase [Pseudomonadales bacterium]|jgi:sugar transferase (PEP-CTERM/EpsH1 system associated)